MPSAVRTSRWLTCGATYDSGLLLSNPTDPNITRNTILGNGTINGLALRSGDTLIVRNNPTAVHAVGSTASFAAGSTLEIVNDGTPWTSTISFDSGAAVSIGGALELSVDPSVSIRSLVGTSTLRLFDWTGATRTGAFTIASDGIVGLGCWNVSNLYATGNVTLTILGGDANLDGKVDINDLTIVLANYNRIGMTWTQGEFTGDGTVDINDLTIVLANYGQSAGAAADVGVGAVPEPSAVAVLASGLIGLLACVWRKRK